jgi:DNA-binding MarR family transcriptional regulator
MKPAKPFADILGYQLDRTRNAASRSLRSHLGDSPLSPATITALLLVHDRPGCDQTILGRALFGNRSVGMKVASRLEAEGYLARGEGRDRRSKGLYITPEGESVLGEALRRHAHAESVLAARLTTNERATLLSLLAKVRHAIDDDRSVSRAVPASGASDTLALETREAQNHQEGAVPV